MRNFVTCLVLICTPLCALADTLLNHTMVTAVPLTVDVKTINSGQTTSGINPANGNINTIAGRFAIATNGSGEDCNFVLQATVQTLDGGIQNAYYKGPGTTDYIVLANNSAGKLPTLSSLNNIKSGVPDVRLNPNAIGYAISTSVGGGLKGVKREDSSKYDGLHYKIDITGAQTGMVSQSVHSQASSGSYSLFNDEPGNYEVTITLNALGNP